MLNYSKLEDVYSRHWVHNIAWHYHNSSTHTIYVLRHSRAFVDTTISYAYDNFKGEILSNALYFMHSNTMNY